MKAGVTVECDGASAVEVELAVEFIGVVMWEAEVVVKLSSVAPE